MSVVPASLDTERSAFAPTVAQESRAATENNFQDAIDARRAERDRADERAQAASESERAQADARQVDGQQADVQAERVHEERAHDERVARERSAAHDASESQSDEQANRVDDSRTDDRPRADANQAPASSSTSSDANRADAKRAPSGAAETATESTGPALPTRTLKKPSATGDAATRAESTTDNAIELPWFAQATIESVFAHALQGAPHSASSTGNTVANAEIAAAKIAAPADTIAPAHTTRTAVTAKLSAEALPSAAPDAGAPSPQHTTHVATTTAAFAIDARAANAIAAPQPALDPTAAQAQPARVTPADLPSFLDRLAVTIDAPVRGATVDLEPAELGRLRIALSLEPNGHVRAELSAERPDGYAALQARLPELHAGLIERGFASASMSLSLGLAERNAQQNTGDRGLTRSSSSARRTLADAEVLAMAPARASGAIDMWA